MTTVELKDATDAPEGLTLHRYQVELSRCVTQKERGRVFVVTASPPEQLKDRWDEVWSAVDNRELLDVDGWSRDEDRHREAIISHETVTKRCPFTAEMKF